MIPFAEGLSLSDLEERQRAFDETLEHVEKQYFSYRSENECRKNEEVCFSFSLLFSFTLLHNFLSRVQLCGPENQLIFQFCTLNVHCSFRPVQVSDYDTDTF